MPPPPQETYSETLPDQPWWKRSVFSSL